ncbi:MAG: 3-methyl-2-oxobutanoate hydroxymethyltransferase [Deltaproteobacteria bacterium]|jgi:3-methyl-2-oxobutanoate hydroxymethyltransferase|nr:3-methyl-2-oxobutanoate hydroxymethyltransferase [Deltaproteobacteria bacterium]
MPKITVPEFALKKERGEKFAMVTLYDYPLAALADRSSIEVILVGDSLAMVVQGQKSTVTATMPEMIYHVKNVRRGAPNTFLVGDMCFMSYQACEKEAVRNAGALMQAGADCVKIEGNRWTAPKVETVVKAGLPVMGHIGLTPQTASTLGGLKRQGADPESAKNLLADALAFQEAGVFCLVLECLPAALARAIDQRLTIPTLSAGSGPCSTGIHLNAYDMLGVFDPPTPKYVKRYRELGREIAEVFEQWRRDVAEGQYPLPEHSYKVDESEIFEILKESK